MRFSGQIRVGFETAVLLGVLLGGTLGVADAVDHDHHEVTIFVNDSVRVSPAVLDKAEGETARIFRRANIDVTWVNCQGKVAGDACRVPPSTNQFVLHIVPNGKTSGDSVFGVAFLGPDGRGKYCDVFFNLIEEAHRKSGANLPRLLGAVVAHEFGHLLLGSQAHSWMGVMEPVWEEQSMRQVEMGTLLFTREQSARMKERIDSEEMRWARAESKVAE